MPTKEFLATFTQAWNEADVDALMDHFHDKDCSFFTSVGFDVERSVLAERKSERVARVSMWATQTLTSKQLVKIFFLETEECSEWIFTGTRKADGKKVKVRGCDVYTFKDEKICIKNSMQQEP